MARARTEEIRKMMANNRLFNHLDDEEMDALLPHVQVRSYKPNQTIFLKNDPGISVMGVISGRVKISNFSGEGKEVVLNIIDPGTFFGEIALLDGKDRTANATAMDASDILVLQRRDFLPFLETHPHWAIKLIEVLCHRVRLTTELVEDSAFLTLPTRLAKRLVWLADNYGQETDEGTRIELKLTQRELGGLVGLSRENINRQLRSWHKEGLISMDSGTITIVDADTINDLADYFV